MTVQEDKARSSSWPEVRGKYFQKRYLWPSICLSLLPFLLLRLIVFFEVTFPLDSRRSVTPFMRSQLLLHRNSGNGIEIFRFNRTGANGTIADESAIVRPDEDAWITHDNFMSHTPASAKGTNHFKESNNKELFQTSSRPGRDRGIQNFGLPEDNEIEDQANTESVRKVEKGTKAAPLASEDGARSQDQIRRIVAKEEQMNNDGKDKTEKVKDRVAFGQIKEKEEWTRGDEERKARKKKFTEDTITPSGETKAKGDAKQRAEKRKREGPEERKNEHTDRGGEVAEEKENEIEAKRKEEEQTLEAAEQKVEAKRKTEEKRSAAERREEERRKVDAERKVADERQTEAKGKEEEREAEEQKRKVHEERKAEDEREAEAKRKEVEREVAAEREAEEQKRKLDEERKAAEEREAEAKRKEEERKVAAGREAAEKRSEEEQKRVAEERENDEKEKKDGTSYAIGGDPAAQDTNTDEKKTENEDRGASENDADSLQFKSADDSKSTNNQIQGEAQQLNEEKREESTSSEDATVPNEQSWRPGECDLHDGTWEYDPEGPLYTNATCAYIEGHQNCMANGRPDTEYQNWRWKPRYCDLPRFDAWAFLEAFRGKTIGFVGDSLARNQMQSLLCMLAQVEKPTLLQDYDYIVKWLYEPHQVTVVVVWSPYLLKHSEDELAGYEGLPSVLYLDVLEPRWTSFLPDLDLIVLSIGQWYFKQSVYIRQDEVVGCHYCPMLNNVTEIGFFDQYREALRQVLEKVASDMKGIVIMSTFAIQHFEHGPWDKGGDCRREKPLQVEELPLFAGMHDEMRAIVMSEFLRVANDQSKQRPDLHFDFLDVTKVSLLRADGHPGPYRKPHPYGGGKDPSEWLVNDCLHWCLPGPVDTWNQLLVKIAHRYL